MNNMYLKIINYSIKKHVENIARPGLDKTHFGYVNLNIFERYQSSNPPKFFIIKPYKFKE